MFKKLILTYFTILILFSCSDAVKVTANPDPVVDPIVDPIVDPQPEEPLAPPYKETYTEIFADNFLQIGDLYNVIPKIITINEEEYIHGIEDVSDMNMNLSESV